MKSNLENLNFQTSIREQVVPSRKKVKLPAWLEVAKPRLIPLLLATTLGGMALTEEWPLSSPKLICTLGAEVPWQPRQQEHLIVCGKWTWIRG